jgi:N,N'-diacetylchitobiose transport system permease protein
MRTLVTAALVLAWSMPVVVATQLWLWMTNYENGVINYLFAKLGFGNFIQYDWFANTIVGFGVITSLIVWGAVPFVAVTVYAGLTQVPAELLEAADLDGSGAFARFRDITFPILKPIFVILASLSVIWDFQVFTQPFLLLQQRPDPGYWLMSIYAYEKSFGISQYGLGSAIALVMLGLMLAVTFFYIRQMIRIGEVR